MCMTLFRNKYRIESTRLIGWDYGWPAYYYVTICTKARIEHFGQVSGNDVRLSSAGDIVAEEWLLTGELRDNVILDEWIIMPNHLHLILVITHKIEPKRVQKMPLQDISKRTAKATEKWAANTLGSIIGQFKGQCTKRINDAGFGDFEWQPRFYDRIIRSEESLVKARKYIVANPSNWESDRDNLAGLYM